MYILEIKNLIETLRHTQNSLSEMLNDDTDYNALKKLPSRENASISYDILRGPNLRAKLELRYASPSIEEAKTKLNEALLQFESVLNLIDERGLDEEPAIDRDCRDEVVPIEKVKNPLNGRAICRAAAENAVVLAKMSNSQSSDRTADIVIANAPSVEDDQRINIEKIDLSTSDNLIVFPEPIVKIAKDLPDEIRDDNDVQYVPISVPASMIGRAMAASIIALTAVVTIGAMLPETAEASWQLFH